MDHLTAATRHVSFRVLVASVMLSICFGLPMSPVSALAQETGGAASMPMTGDADHDFAMMMKKHHEDGIKMAEKELANGKDPAMKKMAQNIADTQKKEVAEFDRWLNDHKAAGHGSR